MIQNQNLCNNYNATKMQIAGIVISSIVSKLIASSISYPHEVLRSRLQDDRSPRVRETSPHKLSVARGISKFIYIHIT